MQNQKNTVSREGSRSRASPPRAHRMFTNLLPAERHTFAIFIPALEGDTPSWYRANGKYCVGTFAFRRILLCDRSNFTRIESTRSIFLRKPRTTWKLYCQTNDPRIERRENKEDEGNDAESDVEDEMWTAFFAR